MRRHRWLQYVYFSCLHRPTLIALQAAKSSAKEKSDAEEPADEEDE